MKARIFALLLALGVGYSMTSSLESKPSSQKHTLVHIELHPDRVVMHEEGLFYEDFSGELKALRSLPHRRGRLVGTTDNQPSQAESRLCGGCWLPMIEGNGAWYCGNSSCEYFGLPQ